LDKNYQTPDDQVKAFQKFINYNRLTALIDNEEVVMEEKIIQQDHLLAIDKVRNKFMYLKQIHDRIA
jgi:hypothetical protein